jgi:hypothetical protein
MKRSLKKIELRRETLHALTASHLGRVAAAYSDYAGNCKTQIHYGCSITTETQMTCPDSAGCTDTFTYPGTFTCPTQLD